MWDTLHGGRCSHGTHRILRQISMRTVFLVKTGRIATSVGVSYLCSFCESIIHAVVAQMKCQVSHPNGIVTARFWIKQHLIFWKILQNYFSDKGFLKEKELAHSKVRGEATAAGRDEGSGVTPMYQLEILYIFLSAYRNQKVKFNICRTDWLKEKQSRKTLV